MPLRVRSGRSRWLRECSYTSRFVCKVSEPLLIGINATSAARVAAMAASATSDFALTKAVTTSSFVCVVIFSRIVAMYLPTLAMGSSQTFCKKRSYSDKTLFASFRIYAGVNATIVLDGEVDSEEALQSINAGGAVVVRATSITMSSVRLAFAPLSTPTSPSKLKPFRICPRRDYSSSSSSALYPARESLMARGAPSPLHARFFTTVCTAVACFAIAL